jgi:hypothetical protein
MKGVVSVGYKYPGDVVERTLKTDFHFRLRDLENFFVGADGVIVAQIGRIERVFEYDEELEEEMKRELSGRK